MTEGSSSTGTRVGRSPAHNIHPPHSAFRPLAWMDPRPFLTSPKKFISWLSPILTMFGSTLFAINNASQASKHVSPPSLLHCRHATVRLQSYHVTSGCAAMSRDLLLCTMAADVRVCLALRTGLTSGSCDAFSFYKLLHDLSSLWVLAAAHAGRSGNCLTCM